MDRSEEEPAPVAELFPPQNRWTEADYFALPEANRHLELSEGRLIMPPHPTRRHQVAVQELYARLREFVLERGLGDLYVAPLPVRLWPGKIREPDVFFVAVEHRDRIGEQYIGVPDLVVEVLSPGTRDVDRGEKFLEYARAGVVEYWLADPDRRTIEVYVLRGMAYEPLGGSVPGASARSELLPGFEVEVGQVFGE